MRLVDKAVELSASPSEVERRAGLERTEDVANGSERDGAELASLDARHRLLARRRSSGQLRLAPGSPPAQRSHDVPDPDIVHRPIILARDCPSLTSRSTPGRDMRQT